MLVKLAGGTEELARQLAMHISFAAPEWTTKDEVPAEAIEAEKQVYLNSDELEGKPEQAKEKIVEGMLAKRFFAAQPGGCSPSSRGSTTRRRRWARRWTRRGRMSSPSSASLSQNRHLCLL